MSARARQKIDRRWPWRDPDETPPPRLCDWQGCDGVAEYRAPKAPDRLRDYHWFCLDHVREYNSRWNFFDGVDAHGIESERRQDAVWHRPSWPMGTRSAAEVLRAARNGFADIFGVLGNGAAPPPPRPPTPREEALAKLGLDGEVSPEALKSRYKELVKRHHPDANGGCKVAEERFKTINEAYTYLLNRDGR